MKTILGTRLAAVALLLAFSGSLHAATYTFTNTANANWFNPTNWSPNAVPSAADTANVSHSVTLTNAASIGVLNLSGGTFSASTFGLTMGLGGNWTGGTLSGNVTNSSISSPFVLNNPGGTLDLPATTFVNNGNATWIAGTIRGGATTVIVNTGTWVVQTNSPVNNALGGTPVFNNTNGGMLIINPTNGTVAFAGVSLNNTGVSSVSVQTGVLQLSAGGLLTSPFAVSAGASVQLTGGAFIAGSGYAFTGSGSSALTGGTLLASNDISSGLLLQGGTITPGPIFQNNGAITNLTLSGATLAGTNTLSGNLNWAAGSVSGALTISSTGSLNLSGALAVTLYAALTNSGQILWNGSGDWIVYNDASANHGSINNLASGVILAQCNNTIASGSGHEWFNNAGVFTKSLSLGSTYDNIPFTNSGTVTVESGALVFNAGGYFGGAFNTTNGATITFNSGGVLAGAFSAASDATVNFGTGTFTQSGSPTFSGSGTLQMSQSGNLTLPTQVPANLQLNSGTIYLGPGFQGGSITNLTLTGATLAGSNFVTGVLNFYGANDSTTGPLVIGPGATMNWAGGTLNGGIVISNGAVVNISGTASASEYLATGSMTNAGTVNWTGAQLAVWYGSSIYNLPTGVFNIECDKTMTYYYGTETFQNAGLLQKFGTTGLTYFYPTFSNTGSLVVQSGSLYFTGSGSAQILGGSVVALAGSTIDFDQGGVLSGNFTAASGANINLVSGNFTPTPTLAFNGPGTNNLSGATIILSNNLIPNLQYLNGDVMLEPGFQGGSITNLTLPGASLMGTNTVSGVLNLDGNILGPLTVLSNATLNLNGDIESNLTLAPGATLNWTNGFLNSGIQFVIDSNAVVNLLGPNYFYFYAPVTNAGVVNWIHGSIGLDSPFYNLPGAAFNIQSTGAGVTSNPFYNSGLLLYSTPGGSTQIYWTIDNTGIVDVRSGSLTINGAIQNLNQYGTWTVEAGATLDLGGGGYLTGEFTAEGGGTINFVNGSFTNTTTTLLDGVGAYNLNGGTYNLLYSFPANLNLISGAVDPGPFYQGGSISGLTLNNISLAGSNVVTGVLNIVNGSINGPLTVGAGGVVTVNGYITAPISLLSGAVLNWNGVYMEDPITIAAGATFNLSPTNLAYLDAPITNSGTLNWRGNFIFLDDYISHGDFYNLAGGQFNILTDQIIESAYDDFIVNYGTIRKSATFGANTFTGGTVTNFGIIDVESGELLFENTFQQTGGTWDFGISGPTNYGVVAFADGAIATQPGTLNVALNNGYIPSQGANFSIIDFQSGSLAGSILSTNLPSVGATWNLVAGTTNISLDVTGLSVPQVTLTSPANNAYLVAPSSISISASAISTNGYPVAQVQFFQNGVYIGQDTSSPYNFNWTPVAPGNYAITAVATDTNGGIGVSAPVNITVVSAGPQSTNYTWTGAVSSDWFTAGNWFPNSVPGALDYVAISNTSGAIPNPILSHGTSVNKVVLNAGGIGGVGALTVTNLFTWTGGGISNTLVIPTNSTLLIAAAASVSLTNATLINMGQVTWTNGTILCSSSTAITNSGTWLIEGNNQLVLGVTPPGGVFVNNGVILKSAGAAPSTFTGGNFINNGTVESGSGTLRIANISTLAGAFNTASGAFISLGGTSTMGAPPGISGQGITEFSGASLTILTDCPPALLLLSGSITLGPAFQNAGAITNLTISGANLIGTNTVTGTLSCANCAIGAGQLTVAPTGQLILGNSVLTTVNLQNLNLVNSGEVLWMGGYISGTSSSSITNNNLWLIDGGSQLEYGANFVNNGTIRQTVVADSALLCTLVNINGIVDAEAGAIQLDGGGSFAGAYNAAFGATIAFGGGTNVLNTLPNFTGLGSFTFDGGTLVMNNDIDPALQLLAGTVVLGPAFQGGTINNLTLQGASLSGTNTVTGNLTVIDSGYVSGALTINSNATLTLASATLTISAGVVTNFGLVLCTGYSTISIVNTTPITLVNYGLWLNDGVLTFSDYYPESLVPLFINNGIFRQQGAVSYAYFQDVQANNTGLFDVEGGAAFFETGGVLGGTYNVTAPANVYMDNGAFTASLPPPVFSGTGTSQLLGGTLLLQNDQIPGLSLSTGTVMLGPNFQNLGAITNLLLSGATLAGTNIVSGTLTLAQNSGFTGNLTIQSNALLLITGANNKSFNGNVLLNQGVVDWTGGGIYPGATMVFSNIGTWLVETDSYFDNPYYGTYSNFFFNAGNFTKTTTTGTTILEGIAFRNAGTLDIESGTLSMTANNGNTFTQTGATLAFGITAPNFAGQLALSTNTSLDGTLLVHALNGYTPNLGDIIPIITFGSGGGQFANLDLPDVPGGNAWDLEYGASGVNLRVVPGVTNVQTYLISGYVTSQSGPPIPGVTVYASQTGATNLILNGGFEIPPSPAGSYVLYTNGSTNIPGWSVIVGTIDLDTASQFGAPTSEEGLQFFDPTGSAGLNGGITQTFPTVPGTTYDLVFYHGGTSRSHLNNVLGVTIAGNYFTYNETDGAGANFDWRRVQIPFTATSNFTTVTFQGLLNFNSDDNWVDNVQVIPPGLDTDPQGVTDPTGYYQITVPIGTYQVGVGGLASAGYNPVALQDVSVTATNGAANFVATPATTRQTFTVATSVNPPALGSANGGGSGFTAGSQVTVVATQNASALPYYFAGWTENGVLGSTSLSYSFPAFRNRVLVANFSLPGLLLAVSNSPPADGVVTGTGIYTYNATSYLSAFPYTGYRFVNWTENGSVISTNTTLSTLVLASHSYVANFTDANPTHTVTTATSPLGLGPISGGGIYTNNQTAIITAPAAFTNGAGNSAILYLFQGFTLNGAPVASSTSFSKTFSTFDAPALQYVAVYAAYPIQPQVIRASDNYPNPIPATTGFFLTFQFDRSMQMLPAPLVFLTNASPTATQPTVSSNGIWSSTVFNNDTYQTPGITFGSNMDGTVNVLISRVSDVYGHVLAVTNVTNIIVKSTLPPAPVVAITGPTNGSIFSTASGFTINATATSSNIISQVSFYANGVLLGTSTTAPYGWNVTSLAQGSYALTTVATDQAGLHGTSGVVHVTVEGPGVELLDFEALDASAGGVGGAALSNYFAEFGVVVSNVSPAGASLAVENDHVFLGGGVVRATSGDNLLEEAGASGAQSYALGFSREYASVSWKRAGLVAGTTGASLPAWRAHVFDINGKELGSVGESARASFTDISPAAFTLLGPGIASIEFDGNSGGASALATLPLDDLLLSTVATNTTLAVNLSTGPATVLSAPGVVALSATVTDNLGSVTNVEFFENGNLLGTAAPAGGVAILTLGNVGPGAYGFTAVAIDNLGSVASSTVLSLTVSPSAGVGVVNFDSLNTAGGSVGGVVLSNYLNGFGIIAANVTVGTALEALAGGIVTGSGGAVASSPPNYFTQAGLNQPVSFTLRFASPLGGFGFTRVGLLVGAAGVSHPQWLARAYDASGVELGQVGEGLIVSATNVPSRSFELGGLIGDGIASIRFDSDSQGIAAFSAVLLDDLITYSTTVPSELSVSILSPQGGASFGAPANITLGASVTDQLGTNYSVNFFAGPNLVGSVSNSPYNFIWSNVLAGTYSLRAEALDASGLAAYSSPVNITVTAGGNSAVVNFDQPSATSGPVTGTLLSNYLAMNGMTLANVSAGTAVAIENQALLAGGGEIAASSPPNVLTQTGGSGPVSYTINFNPWIGQFGFTRPELVASPFVSHPAWQATAYDGAGVILGQVSESQTGGYTDVGARVFTLPGGGAGIASVQFSSEGSGLTTFNALVADDFVLTASSQTAYPPAVAITNPVDGAFLTPGVPVAVGVASAGQGTVGVAVNLYANGALVGGPAQNGQVDWTNGGPGSYALTAVASNMVSGGLLRTSAVVTVTVLPPSNQLAILSVQPPAQTNAIGSSASFTVNVSGTNGFNCQWYQNGMELTGQTGQTLTVFPVGSDDGGNYTVTVTPLDASLAPLTSPPAVLTVALPPVITMSPSAQTVQTGANVTNSVTATASGQLNYQWLLNGTAIIGASASNFLILAAQPLNSGSYQAVVADSLASVASAPALVTVQGGSGVVETADNFANRISINPLLGPVSGNNTAATAEPGEPLCDGKPGGKTIWYSWTAGFTGVISLTTLGSDFDTLLAVYTGTNLTQLTSVAADDDSGGYFTSLVTFNVTAGITYQIQVDGFRGASGNVLLGLPAGTGYRVLSASTGNTVPVILQQPTNQLVAAGSKVTNHVAAGGSGPLSYQWYFQGAPVSGGTGSNLVISNFQAAAVGLYDVLVANSVGSVESEQASVQIANGSTASAHDKFGDAVDLSSGGSTSTSVADKPAAGGDTRGYSVSQTFSTVGATKEVGEPNHCGQPGGASQWYIYTTPAGVTGTLHVSTAGSSFNTILAVYTGPGTNFASLVPQACGFTTNYQTQGQPDLVIPNVPGGTTFYIAVDGYNGASGRAQLHIGLGAAPTLLAMPQSEETTAGSNATFHVTAIGSTNLYYQWQLNGANIPQATNPAYTSGLAGNYTVVVSNVVGVVTSAPPALLTLQYAPGINTNPTNVTVVVGKKASFAVAAVGVNTKANPFHYQWYYTNDTVNTPAPVPGATASNLVFASAQWTNNGSYFVVVSNSYGMATSAPPAQLTVLDTKPPLVSIKSPANAFVTLTNLVLVNGTASDASGVQFVLVQVNTNGFQPAAGTTAWKTNVTLVPGTNTITAQSVDLAGNTNTVPARITIIYKVGEYLTLVTNGTGKVTSTDGAVNNAFLIVSNIYNVTAANIPASGFLFSNWVSGTNLAALTNAATTPLLTFPMTTNLIVQANFATNPFPPAAGTYNGLFSPADGVTEASSGFLRATLQSNGTGTFSAVLLLQGQSNSFSGTFDLTGTALTNLTLANKTRIGIQLNLPLYPADSQMTGIVSNLPAGGWVSGLQAWRAIFSAATLPATNYAGQYTLILPPAADAPATSPGGYSYALLTNSLGGVITLSGILADGSPISQSVGLGPDGAFPLYQSLYKGAGSLQGWIYLTNQWEQTNYGQLNWIKPAVAGTLYPLGFSNLAFNALGSPYTNATLGGGPAFIPADGTLILANGNLAQPLAYTIGLQNNRLTNITGLPTNYLVIAVNPINGLVTVTNQPTGQKTNIVAKGAILQNQTNALGAFRGTNQSGTLEIQ